MSTPKSAGRTPAPRMRALGRRSTVVALALVVAAACVAGATAGKQQGLAGPTYKEVGRWGKLGSGNGQFAVAFGLATSKSGDVYAADTDNFRIQRFSATGAFKGKIQYAQGESASDVAIAPDGTVWGTVLNAGEARQFSAAGGKLSTVKTPSQAAGVAVNAAGDVLVASGDKVIRYAKSGSEYAQAQAIGGFRQPYDVEVSPDGSIWVSDSQALVVKRFDASGKLLKTIKAGADSFIAVGVDLDCNAWVSNTPQRRIDLYSPGGKLLGSAASADLIARDIAVGPKGDLYVFDQSTRSVIRFAEDKSKPQTANVGGITVAKQGAKLVARVKFTLSGVSCPAQVNGTATLSGAVKGKAAVKVPAGRATTLTIPVKGASGKAQFKIVLRTNGRPTTQTASVSVNVR